MSTKFKIPSSPVDGFRLAWWAVTEWGVHECSATYFVNTPWIQHPWSGGEPGGAPFIDDWAIEENGCSRGRREGWAELVKFLNNADVHATRAGANAAFLKFLDSRIRTYQDRLRELTEQREAAVAELEGKSDG